jgi:polyvinyl alcohol dehydrogenase (cytochrome)
MWRSVAGHLLLWVCASAAWGAENDSANGVWKGVLKTSGQEQRIVLHIETDRGTIHGTLDSPDTGRLAIPLEAVKIHEKALEFEVHEPHAAFQGSLSADGNSLTGDWKQELEVTHVGFTRLGEAPDFKQDGSYLFQANCAGCHAPFNPVRAPWPATLKVMQRSAILSALETGRMRAAGATLSPEQRAAIVNYLGRSDPAQPSAAVNACPAGAKGMTNTPLWNGWGADLANSRFQSAEKAGLNKEQIPRLKVKWAFGYAGATGAGGQPTVIGDRIFVAGGDGRVYSLDMHTGCAYWVFQPAAPVRAAISVSADGSLAYFGDMQARAYAVDTATGAQAWRTEVDDHPFAMITGAPRLSEGKLYVPVSSAEEWGGMNPKYPCCSFRGSVSALDAKTGKVLWKAYTIDTPAKPTSKSAAGTQLQGPSGAGVWSSPTVDVSRHLLYIGTGDNYSDPATATSDAVMALELETGKVLWTKQLTVEDKFNVACMQEDKSSCPKEPGGDFDIGAPPILRTLIDGQNLLIVGQKSGVTFGLDPDHKGKIVWQTRLGKGGVLGGIEFGGAASDTQVYFPLSDWSKDPKAGGGMFALDVATGTRLWTTPAPEPACLDKAGCGAAQMAPATALADAVFSGSLDGHIRAYDALDGKVIWDFDTATNFPTVNGAEAHGGSINYAGTVVAGGIVFVPSGYSFNAGMTGNVLLAFTVDGK